jgi:hypothetical protein
MTCLLLISSLLPPPSSVLRADGGAVRLSEQQGNYRITVFTTPTPLRAGPVDVSVFVQDASTGESSTEVRVTIRAVRRGSPGVTVQHPATTEAATNKLYHAATFDLPEPGWYALEVSVAGARGEARTHLELEAAEPLPPWRALWPWVAWPLLAILLFSIHQHLVRRRARRVAATAVTRSAIQPDNSGGRMHNDICQGDITPRFSRKKAARRECR